jgi:hypothetical protein
VRGQLGELGGDLLEAQPDPLGEDDEGDPAQHRARVAAVMAGAVALGRRDQAALFVVAEGGGGNAGALRRLRDRRPR